MNDEMFNRAMGVVENINILDIAKSLDEYGIKYTIKFKPNDVVRYIGEYTTFSLDTSKLYVVNSSEIYGGALYVADNICRQNFLIDSKPEMFTLVYRENV